MTGCLTCGGYGNRHDPIAHGTVDEQPTPHVCQFCETPLADHWWDACTYTPDKHDTSDDERGDLMETDWRGRNVRIFPGWDVLRRAPFVEGHVVSLRPAMWVVRDAQGVEQEWPVTLPIEEA